MGVSPSRCSLNRFRSIDELLELTMGRAALTVALLSGQGVSHWPTPQVSLGVLPEAWPVTSVVLGDSGMAPMSPGWALQSLLLQTVVRAV